MTHKSSTSATETRSSSGRSGGKGAASTVRGGDSTYGGDAANMATHGGVSATTFGLGFTDNGSSSEDSEWDRIEGRGAGLRTVNRSVSHVAPQASHRSMGAWTAGTDEDDERLPSSTSGRLGLRDRTDSGGVARGWDVWGWLTRYVSRLLFQGHTGAVRYFTVTDSQFRKSSSSTVSTAPETVVCPPGVARRATGCTGKLHRCGACALCTRSRYVHTKWLFSAGDDGTVRRFDVETAQCVMVYRVSDSQESAEKLIVTPDTHSRRARLFVLVAGACMVRVYDVRTGLELEALTGDHRVSITSFTIFQGFAYAGADDGSVLEFELRSRQRTRTFTGWASSAVTALCVHVVRRAEESADGRKHRRFRGGGKSSARRAASRTTSDLHVEDVDGDDNRSRDAERVSSTAILYASAGSSGAWGVDLTTGDWIATRFRTKSAITCMDVVERGMGSSTAASVVCGCEDGSIRYLDTTSGKQTMAIVSGQAPVRSIFLLGNYILCGGGGETVRGMGSKLPSGPSVTVINLNTTKQLPRFSGFLGPVTAMVVTDNESLWASSEDGSVRTFNLTSTTLTSSYHSAPIDTLRSVIVACVTVLQLLSVLFSYAGLTGVDALCVFRLRFHGGSSIADDPWYSVKLGWVITVVLLTFAAVRLGVARRARRRSRRAVVQSNTAASTRDLADADTGLALIAHRQARLRGSRESLKKQAQIWSVVYSVSWGLPWLMGTVLQWGVLETLFSAFRCVDTADGASHLATSPDVECWSGEHTAMMAFAFACIVLYIPIAMRLGRMDGDVHSLRRPTSTCTYGVRAWIGQQLRWSDDRQHPVSNALLKVNTSYDTVLCVVRLVLVCHDVFLHDFGPTSDAGMAVFTVCLLVLWMTTTRRSPYARAGVSHVHASLLVALLLVAGAALCLCNDPDLAASIVQLTASPHRPFPTVTVLIGLVPALMLGYSLDMVAWSRCCSRRRRHVAGVYE